jgi:7-keto-8-aminopelargonate synthetase-like enzyme
MIENEIAKVMQAGSPKRIVSKRVRERANISIDLAREAGLIHLYAQNHEIIGNTILLEGTSVTNFGWGGYLGLELDHRLIDGAVDALKRYGVQFASSRAYVSSPLYSILEEKLHALFRQPVLIASTVTLGHQSCMPVAIGGEDVLILDASCHSCMKEVVPSLASKGTTIAILPHNDMNVLGQYLESMENDNRKIWYAMDGLYSMHGDFAPLSTLTDFLDRYPNFHLYIDDAHSMSWIGDQGTGFVFPLLSHHPRTIIALSMAKAYGAGGAIFLVPDAELRQSIRSFGSTMIFSGPIQNPVLGACIASADIHLSRAVSKLQDKLRAHIDYCNMLLKLNDIVTVTASSSPIFFVEIGSLGKTISAASYLLRRGYYVNAAAYPAVPRGKAGLRFNITCLHTLDQITDFIVSLADVLYHGGVGGL